MIWFCAPVNLSELEFATKGLAHHLNIEFINAGTDWLEACMPIRQEVLQPFGLLHGGASVALAETVASTAALLTVDQSCTSIVGLEINANHLRPVNTGIVKARASPEFIGRRTQVWTVRIKDSTGDLSCLSRATIAIRSKFIA